MRIRRIHIENFGKLHNFDLELEDKQNVIRAENGWGKSTLAAFIKAMFYGLDYTTKRSLKDNERKKYLPWQGGMFGGSLEFLAGEKTYRAERSFGTKEKEDTFTLYDLDTGLESQVYSENLGEELFRLDRAAFERSSFFTQQDFAVSMNDSLSAGLTHVEEDAGDMQNYEKAVASLEERMKYYQRTGNRGQIEELKAERRKVQQMLGDLRDKEAAAAEWKLRIAEKEQRIRALLEKIQKLETQIQDVRAYGEKAAQKAQHDLLKTQAYGKEEQLRKTAEALAEFVSAPADEEELDRFRDMIYRIQTLQVQEEDAAEQVQQARAYLEQLEDSAEDPPKRNMVSKLPAVFLFAAGVFAMIRTWLLPGMFLLTAGLICVFLAMRKAYLSGKRAEVMKGEKASGKQELKEAEEAYDVLKKERESMEQQACRFLRMPMGTDSREMEKRWKLERQRSREYGMLKTMYESQRKEAVRSRKAWMQFREKFSEEELLGFLNLEKPQRDLAELQQELEQLRGNRENLVKELRDDHHQIRALEEEAEQIPELKEEEERLSQKLDAAVREYELLGKTLKYLKTAREQFSARYLKELQEGLLYYLEFLEPEQKQTPFLDVKLKLKIQEAGAFRELESFSAGWQDLFQIAERFSIIDALYKGEQPVLILDDPFVNLDSGKQKRAMDLLEKMAEKRQMIYFTCRT